MFGGMVKCAVGSSYYTWASTVLLILPLDLIKCREMTLVVSTEEELIGAKITTYLMCGGWVIGAVCCSNYYWVATAPMAHRLDLIKQSRRGQVVEASQCLVCEQRSVQL